MQEKAVNLKRPFRNTDDIIKTEALHGIHEISTFELITDTRRKAVMNMMDQSTTDNSSKHGL
jgi:hypothetical protein